jgi:hypothetical protein
VLEDGSPLIEHTVALNTQGEVHLGFDWNSYAEDREKIASAEELLDRSVPLFMQRFDADEEAEPLEYKVKPTDDLLWPLMTEPLY